jgi:hypothetical protein
LVVLELIKKGENRGEGEEEEKGRKRKGEKEEKALDSPTRAPVNNLRPYFHRVC